MGSRGCDKGEKHGGTASVSIVIGAVGYPRGDDGGMKNRAIVLFFVKFPEVGRVKTRLSKDLGPETASQLYRCFVLDMLDTLDIVGADCVLCFTPDEKRRDFEKWLGTVYRFLPQSGLTLGARMENAFTEAFDMGYPAAVLLGSDLPDLPIAIIKTALDDCRSYDSVIGPAKDGGYYLIGFRRDTFVRAVFEGMPWGSPSVLERTLRVLKAHKSRIRVLPEWQDVDTLADLRALMDRSGTTRFCHSRTRSRLDALSSLLPVEKACR
jgi:rSAM/selenodomain-associated transferase 1